VPSTRTLARFLGEAQAAVRLRGQVSVLLTTDRNIRRLNRQFRGKDKATDVLSFPAGEAVAGEVAGDLAVSVPTALRQAREQGHALAVELKVLILHGLLHLNGFDHERDNGEMARRERLLRGRLGLPQGLIERSGERQLKRRTSRKAGHSTHHPSDEDLSLGTPTARVAKAAPRSAQDDKQLKGRRA
jgi:probable rRNA maturation factor